MSKARDIADLDFNSPDIDGGNIDGAVIGGTTPAAGTFTGVNVDGNGSNLTLDNGSNPATVSNLNGNLTINFDTSGAGRNYTIQTNSNNAFRVDSGGDISFYSSDGSSAKMVWDSSTENLGVGTAPASTAKLHISSGVNNTPTVLRVENTDSTIETNQDVNAIQFYTNDASANGTGVTSSITQYALNPGNLYGLSFKTFTGGALYEALKIESSGNVFFNGDINIDGGTGDTSSQDVVQKFERTSSTGNVLAAKLKFVNADTNHGDLKFQVKTTASSAESDSYYTDALTIKGSTGRIGVGVTSPESLVHLYQKGSQDGQLTLSSELNGGEHNAGRIAWNHSAGWDTTITLGTADNHSASFRDELIINKDYVVFNENSNDMDFRVESNDNSHMLFVDAGSNEVGIGTSSPENRMEIRDSNASTNHARGLTITNFSLTANSRAGIIFKNYDNHGASIYSPRTGSTQGKLVLATNTGYNTTEASTDPKLVILYAGGTEQYAAVNDARWFTDSSAFSNPTTDLFTGSTTGSNYPQTCFEVTMYGNGVSANEHQVFKGGGTFDYSSSSNGTAQNLTTYTNYHVGNALPAAPTFALSGNILQMTSYRQTNYDVYRIEVRVWGRSTTQAWGTHQ